VTDRGVRIIFYGFWFAMGMVVGGFVIPVLAGLASR
jgi:hypothetical protein